MRRIRVKSVQTYGKTFIRLACVCVCLFIWQIPRCFSEVLAASLLYKGAQGGCLYSPQVQQTDIISNRVYWYISCEDVSAGRLKSKCYDTETRWYGSPTRHMGKQRYQFNAQTKWLIDDDSDNSKASKAIGHRHHCVNLTCKLIFLTVSIGEAILTCYRRSADSRIANIFNRYTYTHKVIPMWVLDRRLSNSISFDIFNRSVIRILVYGICQPILEHDSVA